MWEANCIPIKEGGEGVAKAEKKRKEKDPEAERLELLEKNFSKGGFIYSAKEEEKPPKKEKKRKLSTEALYNVTLMNFQFHLYELICEINAIPLDYYVLVDSSRGTVQLVNDLKIDDTFKSLSVLKWDEAHGIDTLYFRGRFCTCLLYKMVRMSHRIVKAVCRDMVEDATKKRKYRVQHNALQMWIQIIDTFVVQYLSAKQDYLPSLRKIYELLSYIGKGSKKMSEALPDIERMLLAGDTPGRETNDVVKTAFILSTNATMDKKFLKYCPPFNSDLVYSDDKAVLDQVGGLGFALLKSEKKVGVSLMYRAFREANPKIVSRYWTITEEAPEVTIGLYALELSKIFYGNNVRTKKLIDRLM